MGKNKVQVQCLGCPFSEVIDPAEDILPADVVIDHGQETGHTLTVETEEERPD